MTWDIGVYWNVWVFGFFWTPQTFAIKIGPIHVGVWWLKESLAPRVTETQEGN